MKIQALREMAARNGLGKLADGQGLWLVKPSKDRGKWVLRYFTHGKRRELGLGSWPDVGIAEAREMAATARKTVREGKDPIAERNRPKVAKLTLHKAIESCFEARKAELKRDGDAGRWMSPLSVHIIPKIGKVPVEEVDQHVIKKALDPIWHEKPEAALKALNRVGLALKHGAALGLAVDLQAVLKARALLGKQRREEKHIPSLPYEEATQFYQWLRAQETVAALALRFLMLTCARTSEVRLATKDEIQGDVWIIPAARTKNAKEHRVPLLGEAKRICDSRTTNVMFPAYKGRPISDMAMSALMRREGYIARPHGLRATFRTWCEECTDADFETKEACLGHSVDVGVVGAYQRSDRLDKRRKLLKEWEAYLLG